MVNLVISQTNREHTVLPCSVFASFGENPYLCMVVFLKLKAYAVGSTDMEEDNEAPIFHRPVQNTSHAICQHGERR